MCYIISINLNVQEKLYISETEFLKRHLLEVILVVYTVYSLTGRSKSEDKRACKNTDGKTLTGPLSLLKTACSRLFCNHELLCMHLQAKSKRQEKLCCVRGCLHGVRKILVPGRSQRADHPSTIRFLYSVYMQRDVLLPSTRIFLH